MARKGTIKNMGKVKNEMSDAWKARKAAIDEIQARIDAPETPDVPPQTPDVGTTGDAAKGTAKKAKAPKTPKAAKEPKAKRVGALDAAASVLAAFEAPMRAKDLIEAMAAQGLWTSPTGKTPDATLYAAMAREIKTKGDASRFQVASPGFFTIKA